MTSESTKKTPILFAGILVVLLIAAFVCWAATGPQVLESVKELTITVAHSDNFLLELEHMYAPGDIGERDPYVLEFETTAKTLMEALKPYALLELREEINDMGEPVTVIACADEEYVDNHSGYAWVCYRNSELLEDPIVALPIEDGDSFYFCITSVD